MLIKIIQKNSEEKILESLEKQLISASYGALLCLFSHTTISLDPDTALLHTKALLHERDAQLYFCHNGDLLILWRSHLKETRDALIHIFMQYYKEPLEPFDPERLFIFYDTHAQGEDLRLMLRAKVKEKALSPLTTPPSAPPTAPISMPTLPPWQPALSIEQQRALHMALLARADRNSPEILIVEDQEFSRRLLSSLFEKKFRYYAAKNAQQAAGFFALHAPDIAFLDIELPDVDGHRLAALFKQYDPQCCIVMVTGNNHVKDVEMAKANKVQGFIVKPYNKQKIMTVIDAFTARKVKMVAK
jgi:CheY-like chemotaxis protein